MTKTALKITKATPVWDTPSNMGGTFMVTLIDDDGTSEVVTARVCYGRFRANGSYEPWPDWDGYTFGTRRDTLANPRSLGDRTPKPTR